MVHRRSSSPPANSGTDFASQVRGYGQLLATTERLSLAELQAAQAPLVAKLLHHAYRTTSYYKDKFVGNFDSAEEVASNWSTIPILSRAEAVKNRFKLMSRKPRLDMGPVSEGQTSGATGTPFAYKKNAASDLISTALTERMFRWWSIDGQKSFAQISSYGPGEAPPPEGRRTTDGIQAIRKASSIPSALKPTLTPNCIGCFRASRIISAHIRQS